MSRLSRNDLFMQVAYLMSLRGTCGRLQVGAVLVLDNRIICTGYNGPPAGEPHCSPEYCDVDAPCIRAIHAEENAIIYAAKHGIKLKGSKLFVTTSPCKRCANMIVSVGIKEVYYSEPFREVNYTKELLKQHDILLSEYKIKNGQYTQYIQDHQNEISACYFSYPDQKNGDM